MPNAAPVQTFKNHSRLYPPYHFVLVPLIVLHLTWTVIRLAKRPSVDTGLPVLVAACLLLLAFVARRFALRVQDRVIRLEMRVRLRELSPELAARFSEFTVGQLVALRFAGDAELPALARKVLDERLRDRRAIKQMVKDWQADNLRA